MTTMLKLVMGLVLVLGFKWACACDLCSVYLGINPNDFKNSIGIRYRYRDFQKNYISQGTPNINEKKNTRSLLHEKHGGADNGINEGEVYTYAETYHTYDLMATLFLNPKWQMNITGYFADNYVLQNDSVIANVAGLGDLTLLTNYSIFNSKKNTDADDNKKLISRITVGMGAIIPTGHFNKHHVEMNRRELQTDVFVDVSQNVLDAHLQAGTGAFSGLFVAEYQAKYGQFGVNLASSYRANTQNKNGFRFANRFNANGNLFSQIRITKKLTLMPYIGGNYERANRDQQDGNDMTYSGGKVLFWNGGINWFIRNLRVDLTYFSPVHERLFGDQPYNKARVTGQLIYYFN